MSINWKNKEESAKAVEEVKRKRATKETKKGTKKTQKKKKVSGWKKALRILVLWLIEIAVCAVIVATAWCINTIEGYLDVFELTHKQQDLIEELVHEITEIKTQYQAVEVKEMAYNLTESERELLAQLLYHEARGESLDCQKAVVSVVLNRVESGIWGDTLSEVIYAKNQFEPVARGLLPNTKPLQKQYEAIDYVLENGATIPEDVLYFRADHYFEWGTAYMNLDNTYFSF